MYHTKQIIAYVVVVFIQALHRTVCACFVIDCDTRMTCYIRKGAYTYDVTVLLYTKKNWKCV